MRKAAARVRTPRALLHLIMMYIIASDGALPLEILITTVKHCVHVRYRWRIDPAAHNPSISMRSRAHCSAIGTRANVEKRCAYHDVGEPRALLLAICNNF